MFDIFSNIKYQEFINIKCMNSHISRFHKYKKKYRRRHNNLYMHTLLTFTSLNVTICQSILKPRHEYFILL